MSVRNFIGNIAVALAWVFIRLSAQTAPTVVTITPKVVGTFSEAMSTSFQVAPWTDGTFSANAQLLPELNHLNPHHIRVQVIDKAIPQTDSEHWDFAALDRQLQPILSAADHSPELQLAQAPSFLYKTKTHFVTPEFIAGFAAYAAGMVHHYNAPGIANPIRYWGILNEPDYFGISPAEYVAIYNAAIPTMLAVDPSIKIVALELGGNPEDEQKYIPPFVAGVRVPVDMLGVHFYSTCDRRDTDDTVMKTVPAFAEQLRSIRTQLNVRPSLAHVPIWILENNVNADFVDDTGHSTCNPTQPFVADERGGSAFFAAWRAFEFSQFGKAGATALYHWVFAGDRQYGEIATESASPRLAYWVDLWLGRFFPPVPSTQLIQTVNPREDEIEVLAMRHSDRISVLIANHATGHVEDRNGPGAPRAILLKLDGFGPIATATELILDSATDATVGPEERTIVAKTPIQLEMGGYGAILLSFRLGKAVDRTTRAAHPARYRVQPTSRAVR